MSRPEASGPPRVSALSAEVVRQRADRLAHDFNNLLTTILGYANLLSRSLDEGDPRRADADEIIAGAQRASALVRELEAIGRDPDGGASHRPRGFSDEAAEPAGESEGGAAPGQRPGSRGAILVVDDERTVRYLVRTILTRAGYEVTEAVGADDAEQCLAGCPGSLDLVISDIDLPDRSGPELAGCLRRARPGLKVLFISGHSADEIRRHRHIEPDTPFIQKPFTAEALIEQVQLALFTPGR